MPRERDSIHQQGGEPTGTPPLEARQQLTPRGELERHFEGSFAGSPKVKAIEDLAALMATQSVIDQERRTLKEPLSDVGFVELLTRKAQISETIRKRSSGKHAAAYNASQVKFPRHLENYKQEQKNQLGDVLTADQLTLYAANALRGDVSDINENLPVKE